MPKKLTISVVDPFKSSKSLNSETSEKSAESHSNLSETDIEMQYYILLEGNPDKKIKFICKTDVEDVEKRLNLKSLKFRRYPRTIEHKRDLHRFTYNEIIESGTHYDDNTDYGYTFMRSHRLKEPKKNHVRHKREHGYSGPLEKEFIENKIGYTIDFATTYLLLAKVVNGKCEQFYAEIDDYSAMFRIKITEHDDYMEYYDLCNGEEGYGDDFTEDPNAVKYTFDQMKTRMEFLIAEKAECKKRDKIPLTSSNTSANASANTSRPQSNTIRESVMRDPTVQQILHTEPARRINHTVGQITRSFSKLFKGGKKHKTRKNRL